MIWNHFRNARLRREAERLRDSELRAEEREALLKGLDLIAGNFARAAEAQAQTVSELAAAQAANAKAFSDHLALFQVSTQPISRVMTDQDELRSQHTRSGKEIPPGLTPQQEMQWVLNASATEW